MDAPMESPTQIDDFVFRASKRRKVSSRQRADSNQEEETNANAQISDQQLQNETLNQQQDAPVIPEESDQEELGLNYVIRARKQQQRRQRGGIEFSATRPAFDPQSQAQKNEMDLDVPAAGAGVGDSGMAERFARQTGYKAQVDKHMMAYIDAEIAKRNISAATGESIAGNGSRMAESMSKGESPGTPGTGANPHRPPSATTGALQEVQLEMPLSKRLDGSSDANKAPRVRLGPDGKPWRSRRPRRTSDDLKRDALVESLLQEHGLNAFDNTDSAAPGLLRSVLPGADEDADERAAAEFRRQFLEAAEERRESGGGSAAQPKQKGPGPGPAAGDIAGGPKLGGSRNQRAKMHALELEKEKEKKAAKK